MADVREHRLRMLDALCKLHTLPSAPVEPVDCFFSDIHSALEVPGPAALGRILAPRGISADLVELRGLPQGGSFARPVAFDLVLTRVYRSSEPEELDTALASLATHTCVRAVLVVVPAALEDPPYSLDLAAVISIEEHSHARAVRVSISTPADLSRAASTAVEIRGVTVAGLTPAGFAPPVAIPLFPGLVAPQTLRAPGCFDSGAAKTPAVSADGTLIALKHGHPHLLVYGAGGEPLLPLTPLKSLGLSAFGVAAAVCDETGMLLLVTFSDAAVVAVDLATRSRVLWRQRVRGCYGAAVLPIPRLAVLSNQTQSRLCAHSLVDGAEASAVDVPGSPSVLAADAATSTVYASVDAEVYAVQWDAARGALVPRGVVEAVERARSYRPLAVVPPVPPRRAAHLVVGEHGEAGLAVLELPSCKCVHTHVLDGISVAGLAGDPSGRALVVCDYNAPAIHVLAWPLPGMRSLA